MDVTIGGLNAGDIALKSAHLAVARSALTSINSLRHLTLGDDIPPDVLTNDLLVNLKDTGVAQFVFRSELFKLRARIEEGHFREPRVLVDTCDGGYPDLDAGVTAFLFRGSELEHQTVTLKFPAARVPHDFCQRLLKAAISDGSRSTVQLSFVAAVSDLTVKLERYEEYASEPNGNTIVYKVSQSAASDMILELTIIAIEDAPSGWKLIKFHRYKKPPTSADSGGGGHKWDRLIDEWA